MKYIREYKEIDFEDWDEEETPPYKRTMLYDMKSINVDKLLKIGDKLICDFKSPTDSFLNLNGTIVDIMEWHNNYRLMCVEFDEYIGGHDGIHFGSKYKNGHCRNFTNEDDDSMYFTKR